MILATKNYVDEKRKSRRGRESERKKDYGAAV
jgi:hypothetical protein